MAGHRRSEEEKASAPSKPSGLTWQPEDAVRALEQAEAAAGSPDYGGRVGAICTAITAAVLAERARCATWATWHHAQDVRGAAMAGSLVEDILSGSPRP